MPTTWHPVELAFEAEEPPPNPYLQATLEVEFEHASGIAYTVPGFWDGGTSFYVRFAPTKTARWTWEAESADPGLSGSGSIDVETNSGGRAIHEHGFLEAGERALYHADGTPFFWLADTAWAAGTRASLEEWERYLDYRDEQGYNVVQVNALRQHDGSQPHDRLPFGESWTLEEPNHDYFRHLDAMVAMAHERGIVPALVALWFDYVPGANVDWVPQEVRHEHSPEQARRLGRYLGARYGAYGTAWLVSGDSRFNETCLASYRAAGEALGEACPLPLRTAHQPGGQSTPTIVNEESWLDFHMYQSGHTHDLNQPARQARECRLLAPSRPVLNGEPCYADMQGHSSEEVFDRETVRGAAWVSVLSGANAGVTYGALGIWPWHREGDTFEAADIWGEPKPWDDVLGLPSAADYARLRTTVVEYAIESLNPRPDLLSTTSPGEVTAVLPDAVLGYLRTGRNVTLQNAPVLADVAWLDPATGDLEEPDPTEEADGLGIPAPGFDGDAVLVCER